MLFCSLKNVIKLTDAGLSLLAGASGADLWSSQARRLSPVQALLRASPLRSPLLGPAAARPRRRPPSPPPVLVLDISGCILLTDRGFAALAAAFPALQDLAIGGCSRVSTVTDAALAEVGKLERLTRLDMSGCTQISDAGEEGR